MRVCNRCNGPASHSVSMIYLAGTDVRESLPLFQVAVDESKHGQTADICGSCINTLKEKINCFFHEKPPRPTTHL